MLPEISGGGQERLLGAGVLVVGAGGLGSAVCYYLAAAGVGRIGIADGDRVDLSNLQRQIIHTVADIGRPKVVSAREKLLALNPDITVIEHRLELTWENAAALVDGYDLVIAAVDNCAARYILNDTCDQKKKPLVDGAVGGFTGQVTTFLPPAGPCYRCLFPGHNTVMPHVTGVVGALAGLIGTVQAYEALKHILGAGELLNGRLLYIDALVNDYATYKYGRIPDCPVCGD